MHFLRSRFLVCAVVVCLAAPAILAAADEPNLTKEQMKQFLLNAKVVNGKHTSKGITSPWRLTLTDGTLTHDASFQTIDETKPMVQFATRTELNFRDSWHYNLAAWELAQMVGLDDMMPMTVERKWNGMAGSLTWWLPVVMDEADRLKRKIEPPDTEAWNKQMYRKRVFAQLVYDTDPNATNVLIGSDWKMYMIDFTRAFRTHKDLENTKDLVKCDRQLLEKLKKLDGNELADRTKHHLTKSEVQALMARRDKIVAYLEKLVAEKGENEVLY